MNNNNGTIGVNKKHRMLLVVILASTILAVYYLYGGDGGYKLKCETSYGIGRPQENRVIVIDSPRESAIYWRSSSSISVSGMGLLTNKKMSDGEYKYTYTESMANNLHDSTFIINRSTLHGLLKGGGWSGGVDLACSEASNEDVEKARDEYKALRSERARSRDEENHKNKI